MKIIAKLIDGGFGLLFRCLPLLPHKIGGGCRRYYRWPRILEKPIHFIPSQSASNLKGVSKKSGKGK